MPKPAVPLSLSPSIYASAHFGKSLFWYLSEALFAFVLSELVGLSGFQTGLVLAVGLLFSALLDVAVGARLNHLLRSALTAGRVQLAGAVVTAAAMALLFAMPGTARTGSLWLAMLTSLTFRLAYAFVDIPQNVLLAIGVRDDRDRAALASWRLAASGLASLCVALIASMIVFHRGAILRPLMFALGSGLVAILLCGLLALHVRKLACGEVESVKFDAGPVRGSWFASDRIWLFLGCIFLSSLAAPVFTKLLPYFAAFQMREPIQGISLLVIVSVGMVVGQVLWIRILPFQGWTDRLITAGLAVSASAALFGLTSLVPGISVLIAALLFGVSSGGLGAALWGGYATAVAENCPGQEAIAFGAFTAVSKVSNALGALGLGLLLSNASFRTAGNPRLLVAMMCSPLIAGLAIACLAVTRRSVRQRQRAAPR